MTIVDDQSTSTGDAEPKPIVERAYDSLLHMALSFQLRPGERVNESELARELGISRTPLREALNRLVAQELLSFVPSKGFFRTQIRPREIHELYQLRQALEVMAISLAIRSATPPCIAELRKLARAPEDLMTLDARDLILSDELFHETLAELGGNQELVKTLHSINLRIRPLRHFGLEADRARKNALEHKDIVDAIERKDEATATGIMQQHFTCRYEDVERDVRQLFGEIYVG